MRATRRAAGPQLRWAAGATAVIAVLGAGCSNQIVTRAQPPPALTATTLVQSGPPVSAFVSLAVIEARVIGANLPSAAEIAKAPINVLRTKGLANIKTKLDALNAANATLGTLTHLGAAGVALEKDELNSSIQGLTGLQNQITNEQSLVAMRTEVLQLVNYATIGTTIVPKVAVLAAADTVLRTTDSLNGEIGQLQTRINNAAAKGRDTSAAVAALGTVRGDTAQAASLAGGLMTSVPLLTASQTNQITTDNNTVASARSAASAAQSAVGTVGSALQAVGA
jgi:hypothetical protein